MWPNVRLPDRRCAPGSLPVQAERGKRHRPLPVPRWIEEAKETGSGPRQFGCSRCPRESPLASRKRKSRSRGAWAYRTEKICKEAVACLQGTSAIGAQSQLAKLKIFTPVTDSDPVTTVALNFPDPAGAPATVTKALRRVALVTVMLTKV